MNNTEEAVRLCKKCGKRLPSSNNFCMYCGYNNNLNDEELEALKSINANNIHTQKKQELLNKSINANDRDVVIEKEKHYRIVTPEEQAQITIYKKQHDTLINKIIYALILLDVVFISVILLVKSDGLLYERFNVNLDNYDKVVNLNDESFLGLKENKIEVLGKNKNLSNKNFNKINEEIVLGISAYEPDSNTVFIETKKKIYAMSSSSSYISSNTTYEFKEKEIKSASKNFYKDVSTKFFRNISETGDYYNIIKKNSYFILDDVLYKNIPKNTDRTGLYIDNSNSKSKTNKNPSTTYRSELIYNGLKINNPEIVDIDSSGKTVIIKGDNIIKVISDGQLIQSISSVTYNNKKYNLGDFKYILYRNKTFTFVCQNGSYIKYDYGTNNFQLLEDADLFGAKSKEFKKIHKIELNKNIKINDSDSNNSSMNISTNFLMNNWKPIAILLAVIIFIIAIMYHFREKSFVVSSIIYSGTIFVILLALVVYTISQMKEPKYFEAVKTAFQLIPIDIIIGIMLAEIKEIVSYLTDKFNIETPVHFVLMLIGVMSSLLVASLFTDSIFLLVVLPGLVWIFMTDNYETFKVYDMDLKMYLKIFGTLLISMVLALILCFIFNICQYYLYILIVSFSISCFLVLNDYISFITCFKKFINSNILLFVIFGFLIIYGFISVANINPKYGEEIVAEYTAYYLKGTVLTSFIKMIFVAIISLGCGFGLSAFSKVSKLIIDIFDNRILKIFIYMIILVVLCTIIILLIPVMEDMYVKIAKILLGDKTQLFDIFDLFGGAGLF